MACRGGFSSRCYDCAVSHFSSEHKGHTSDETVGTNHFADMSFPKSPTEFLYSSFGVIDASVLFEVTENSGGQNQVLSLKDLQLTKLEMHRCRREEGTISLQRQGVRAEEWKVRQTGTLRIKQHTFYTY